MSAPDFEDAMRTLAAAEGNPQPLPDADLVWRRAAVRARWRQYEDATRAIRLAERIACLACAASGLATFLTLRPDVNAMGQPLTLLLGATVATTVGVALVLINALRAED